MQNATFQEIFDQLNTGLIAVDRDLKVCFWNKWMSVKSQVLESQAIGYKLDTIFPEIKNTRLTQSIESCFKQGLPAVISNVFNRSPLPLFTDSSRDSKVIQNINLFSVTDNEKLFCIVQISDISAAYDREKALEGQVRERKNAEISLIHTMEELEKASRVKADFLASMSHEIRTPMNGIIGMSHILSSTELNEKQQKYLNIIQSSSNSLLTIINDILDFSKIEAGKMDISPIEFNLHELIDEIVSLSRPLIIDKPIQLKTEYNPDVGDTFFGDNTRIKQVILNLVSNAIKFTYEGDVIIRVEPLQHSDHSQLIKFSIIDQGIGIKKEDISRLFEQFTQADSSTTRKFGGTGLGLTISKKLVNLMSGDIGVESEEGKGSIFWFTLNLPKFSPILATKEKKKTQSVSEEKIQGNALLVEDVYVNQVVAKSILSKIGLDVIVANNGKEAIDYFQQKSFNIIFMDCHMPVLDGYQATKKIRHLESLHNKKHVPIIALTALVLEGDEEKCYDAGMDDYISKPYKEKTIQTIVQKWLIKS